MGSQEKTQPCVKFVLKTGSKFRRRFYNLNWARKRDIKIVARKTAWYGSSKSYVGVSPVRMRLLQVDNCCAVRTPGCERLDQLGSPGPDAAQKRTLQNLTLHIIQPSVSINKDLDSPLKRQYLHDRLYHAHDKQAVSPMARRNDFAETCLGLCSDHFLKHKCAAHHNPGLMQTWQPLKARDERTNVSWTLQCFFCFWLRGPSACNF